MAIPPVQYARTHDGVSIGYTVQGTGPTLIMGQGPFEWMEAMWGPGPAGLLSRSFSVVLYSPRGTGLSDRDVLPESMEDEVADLQAVADAVTNEPFIMAPYTYGAHPALYFTGEYPERVTHLIVYGATGLNQTDRSAEQIQFDATLDAMMAQGLEHGNAFVLRALTMMMTPSQPSEVIDRRSARFAEHLGMKTMVRYAQLSRESTVEIQVAKITAPTLIMHREEDPTEDVAGARMIARAIPGAQLRLLRGGDHILLPGQPELDEYVEALEEFVLGASAAPSQAASDAGATQTILFTDLESSTALTTRLGDAAAQSVLRGHNAAVRKSLEDFGGREVKHTGDGIMAAFTSAVRAVEAASQIQRDLAGGEIRVRIGLNAGEPIAEDDDFFGTSVQLAARICDRAEPGEVVVSRVVADLCAGKQISFESAGETHLKGFDGPVALFRVAQA